MCDAHGRSYGEGKAYGFSTGISRSESRSLVPSNDGHGEGSTHGETEGCGRSYSTGIGHSRSISRWPSSSDVSAQTSARVRDAAAPLEHQLYALAQRLTVAEFHALRTRLEDCCDCILLNGF
jgi:hypothetical protein